MSPVGSIDGRYLRQGTNSNSMQAITIPCQSTFCQDTRQTWWLQIQLVQFNANVKLLARSSAVAERPCDGLCHWILGERWSASPSPSPRVPRRIHQRRETKDLSEDRILMDPGHKARKNPSDNANLGFQAVGPALRIMQLNVEGLSAAKRHIIESLAEIHHIDVIYLQETHVNDDKSDRLTISVFDIISYTLHAKHGCATYVRSDVSDAARVSSSPCCDVIRVSRYHIANIDKPPTGLWNNTNLQPVLPHPAVLVGDFNSNHPDWGYQEADLNVESLQEWAWTTTICCCMTPSNVARSTLQGGNVTTRQTCTGSQRQLVAHSQPPPWFLVTSPTVSTDLQLFTSASNFPSSEESNAEDETSGKLTGQAILSPQIVPFRWFLSTLALRDHTSVSVVLCRKQPAIPIHEASDQRILHVWMRSANQDLLKQYEESGDPDIADHLIESLDVARWHRWEELTSKINFTHSSRKSWAQICRCPVIGRPL